MVVGNFETGRCDLIQGTYFTYSLDCLFLTGEIADLRTFKKTSVNDMPITYPTFNLKWSTQLRSSIWWAMTILRSTVCPIGTSKNVFQRDFSAWLFVSLTYTMYLSVLALFLSENIEVLLSLQISIMQHSVINSNHLRPSSSSVLFLFCGLKSLLTGGVS